MPRLDTQTADAPQDLGLPRLASGYAPRVAFPERAARTVPIGPGTPHGWPLLGREAELAHLMEAIAGGRPGVVLAGASGVGKTRLAREALALAEAAGSATMWVVATRAGASIPPGSFAHLVPEPL